MHRRGLFISAFAFIFEVKSKDGSCGGNNYADNYHCRSHDAYRVVCCKAIKVVRAAAESGKIAVITHSAKAAEAFEHTAYRNFCDYTDNCNA